MQNPLTNVCQSNMKGQFQLKEIRLSISNAILFENRNTTEFDFLVCVSICIRRLSYFEPVQGRHYTYSNNIL